MKTRNLLLALGCAAAFTACTNNDEPAVAPAMRTVTLSVDVAEPADTRVDYTEEGTTYKFEWIDTDKLRVFYNEDGEEKFTPFTISEINGKQATFTGTLPASVTNVTIGYAAQGFMGPSNNIAIVVGADQLGIIGLARNTYLYAENVTITGGENVTLPDVKLQHAAAYLLLKEGLQVVDKSVTGEYFYATPSFSEPWNNLAFSSTGITKVSRSSMQRFPDGSINSEGALTMDMLVSFPVDAAGETLALPFNIYDYDDYTYTFIGNATQPAHLYKPGVIYEVKADNANWEPATLPE